MLTIVGDVIEYDGKPFATITASLSGWRLDAIDCVNNQDIFLIETIKEHVDEALSDARNTVLNLIEHGLETWKINDDSADWLEHEVKRAFNGNAS